MSALDNMIVYLKKVLESQSPYVTGFAVGEAEDDLAQLRAENEQLKNESLAYQVIADLRQENAEARKVIEDLLNVLPDSIHKGEECWDWSWDDLNSEAQDAVVEKRKIASAFLAKYPEPK
jgi:hypothetical protein